MTRCLIIIGAGAHILKRYTPSSYYDEIFFSVSSQKSKTISFSSRSTPFHYDLFDTSFDFEEFSQLLKPHSRIDILYAAYSGLGLKQSDSVSEIQSSVTANCIQPILFFSRVSALFTSIDISGIFISSMYAHVAPYPPNYEHDSEINPLFYGVYKAGVEQGLRWLSVQRPNHCFNSIALGPMPNPRVVNQSPHLITALLQQLPSGQFVNHEELHSLINHILENSPGSLRGTSLRLDGGYTLW